MVDADKEISVSAESLTLKGDVVEDVRPIVRRAAGTADSVLRLLDNVVRLPTDFLSNNLERFRSKYIERFEEIPAERRREPSMRVGCAVLRNVAFSADEDEIQELFANLLAAASDDATQGLVHPGFASVIAELQPLEAKLLVEFASQPRQIDLSRTLAGSSDSSARSRAISNLVRLGLVQWADEVRGHGELRKFLGQAQYIITSSEQAVRTIVPLIKDVQNLKNELVNEFRRQNVRRRLEVTGFGRDFVSATTRRAVAESSPPDPE